MLGQVVAGGVPRFQMDLSARPAAAGLALFDLNVLRVDAQVDLEKAHALGNVCLARVEATVVAEGSAAAVLARRLGMPLAAGPRPGTLSLDGLHEAWTTVLVNEVVETAAERGFDGVVLAGLDGLAGSAQGREAAVLALAAVKRAYPDKKVFVEGPVAWLAAARRHLDGVCFLNDGGVGFEPEVRAAAQMGLPVCVTALAALEDDVAPRAARLRELGVAMFFTTPALEGVNLGPLQEVRRRVLVLHSGPARECQAASIFHGTLEWLGCQVSYVEAGAALAAEAAKDGAPAGLPLEVEAVVLDGTLTLDTAAQGRVAAWVAALRARGAPVLLAGQPFSDPEAWRQVAQVLGLGGDGTELTRTAGVKTAVLDHAWLMENEAHAPRAVALREVRAPAGAHVAVALRTAAGMVVDRVFVKDAVAVWLDPAGVELGPQVRPLPFLQEWLSSKPEMIAPVADTTCLEGRRLLVTHIASNGFTETTSFPGLPTAGEVMRERVLERYSLPFTVALCEGDVRGWTPGVEPLDAARHTETARAIFMLPQVEAASASLSRPERWTLGGEGSGLLNEAARVERPGFEREIAGSLAHIHRQLLPQGRSVPLMTWPGLDAPGAEVVAFSRKMGVENVGLWQPRTMPGCTPAPGPRTWGTGAGLTTLLAQAAGGDSLDVAAQAAQVSLVEKGPWTAPVQVCLDFASVRTAAGLQAVEKLLDTCAAQPLHAITAGHYARLVRDAVGTRVIPEGPGRWLVVNEGHSRTLRLPAAAGVPDLARCSGVAGYRVRDGQVYVHTLGQRRTVLVMTPAGAKPAAGHLHLTEASGTPHFLECGSRSALLRIYHCRPVELTFGGMTPGALCELAANGDVEVRLADARGQASFTVPGMALVHVRTGAAPQAAMR